MQLSEEGAIQTFKRPGIGFEEIIVGVVGVLQFEVLEHRLKTEYNANISPPAAPLPLRALGHQVAQGDRGSEAFQHLFASPRTRATATCILFENEWSIRWALENNEGLELAETASRLG